MFVGHVLDRSQILSPLLSVHKQKHSEAAYFLSSQGGTDVRHIDIVYMSQMCVSSLSVYLFLYQITQDVYHRCVNTTMPHCLNFNNNCWVRP